MSVNALILAAGEARRFGRPKQLLPWGQDETILGRVIAELQATPGIDRVGVVLGAWEEEIRKQMQTRLARVEIISNPDWKQGMFSSLSAGLVKLRGSARPLLILLGDMPFISHDVLSRFPAACDPDDPRPIIATEAGRPAHPYLIRPRHIDEILSLSGESGIRPFIRRHFPEAVKITVSENAGRHDIDTWESYFSRRPAASGPVIPPPPPTFDGLENCRPASP